MIFCTIFFLFKENSFLFVQELLVAVPTLSNCKCGENGDADFANDSLSLLVRNVSARRSSPLAATALFVGAADVAPLEFPLDVAEALLFT